MISYPELAKMGVTQSPFRIRELVREGKFPKPATGSKGKIFQWRESDVKAYLKAKTR